MDFIVDYTPAPSEHEWVQGEAAAGNGEPPKRHETDAEPVSLYVFKTVSDPFAGRISYFKVFSGVLKNDATLQNFSRSSQEKLAHISIMQGKTAVPVTELHAGDIGAVAKLKDTLTGDTLGDKSAPIQYPRVKLPEPAITFAIEPKSRADEDKLGPGIHKLMEEDAMLRFFRDPQTKEFLIAGTGPAAHRSRRLEAEEALSHRSGSESAQGSVPRDHSRQGRRAGTPQEADRRPRPVRRLQDQDGAAAARRRVRIRQRHFRRRDSEELHSGRSKRELKTRRRADIWPDFRWWISGSSSTTVRITTWIRTTCRSRWRAASPSRKPWRWRSPRCSSRSWRSRSPCPTSSPASIMGDLNSRRGRIQGMDNKGGNTVVKAEVPMSEMLTYGVDLTSMTQGRGSFNMEMHHYDVVPGQLQEKIIEKAKAARGEVKEEEE